MTDGLRGLRFIQISAEEATPGTAQKATEILLGNLIWPADDEVKRNPENEDRNSMARHHGNIFNVGKLATMQYTGDVMFRHLPWWLGMSIRGNITATQPDSTNQPNSYLWTHEPTLTAANTPDITNGIDTYTLEYGDNMQAYETEYCFATHIEISGAPNEACQISVDITGAQKLDTTKTAALTVQTIQRAPFNLCTYNRDTSWATLGNTAKAGAMRGFTWAFDTMFTPRFTGDGNLYFAYVDEDVKAPTLSVIMTRGTESDAVRALYESESKTYIQIELFGSTELDSSQSNPPYLVIDGAYTIDSWPAAGDENGMSVVEVPFTGCYDSTGAKMMSLKVLNLLSVLPT